MLETYFVKPQTIDRIRALWIGPEVERYVAWLAGQGYSARSVLRRVPLLAAFGELARLRGARSLADLPGHVDAFVAKRQASPATPAAGRDQLSPRTSAGRSSSSLNLSCPASRAVACASPHAVRRHAPGVFRVPGR